MRTQLVHKTRVVAVAVLTCIGSLIAMPSAHAQALAVSCPGYETNAYSPPFTNTPHSVKVTTTGTLGPCTITPPDPTLPTTASFHGVATGSVSCQGGSFTGTRTYVWGDEHTSTESFTAVISQRPLGEIVAVYQGTITSGLYTGYTTHTTITVFNTTPQGCFDGSGVSTTGGPFTLTLTT